MDLRSAAINVSLASLISLLIISVSVFGIPNTNNVTMMLRFNMSGITYSGYAFNQTSDGTYSSPDISEYYACVNTSGNYTTGLIFTGSYFGNAGLKTDSEIYTINITQSLPGNEFIIPITSGNCDMVMDIMNSTGSYMTGPFAPFAPAGNYTISLTLRYPGVDIVSSEDIESFEAGKYSLLLEKNETGNLTQVIVERG